jgi:hypothetical protein
MSGTFPAFSRIMPGCPCGDTGKEDRNAGYQGVYFIIHVTTKSLNQKFLAFYLIYNF